MTELFNILLPTDVFPPRAGGSGHSAHALACALIERGHRVTAVVPVRNGDGVTQRVEHGVPVVEVGYQATRLPFIANWMRFERFWPHFAAVLVQLGREQPDRPLLIHGQHVQSIGAAVLAGDQLGVPVVGTVRDHWPWHYFDTGLHGDRVPLQRFGWAASATDLIARRSPLIGAASLIALPYIVGHLRRRQELLTRCAAVVAPSHYIAERLTPYVHVQRLHVIPHMIDLAEVDRIIATPPRTVIDEPYVLFAGKLARNKGAHLLPAAMTALHTAGVQATLIIAGGSDPELLGEIAASGVRVRALDWADHDEVLRLMYGCAALVFPSTWGEPLSRVLVEACAVGVPIAAIPTGGTSDLLTHGTTALLAHSAEQLGRAVAQLVLQPRLAQRLAANARHTATTRLAATLVVPQVERLYRSLMYDAAS